MFPYPNLLSIIIFCVGTLFGIKARHWHKSMAIETGWCPTALMTQCLEIIWSLPPKFHPQQSGGEGVFWINICARARNDQQLHWLCVIWWARSESWTRVGRSTWVQSSLDPGQPRGREGWALRCVTPRRNSRLIISINRWNSQSQRKSHQLLISKSKIRLINKKQKQNKQLNLIRFFNC